MSKGKQRPSASGDDDDEEQLTHTLTDLAEEAGPRHARRYTAGQLTDGIIGLVRRKNVNRPDAEPTACEECLEMAVNRTPCPHGTFAPDGQPRPTLVWPYNSPPDALSEASARESGSTTPTPSTILQGTRGLPPLVRYPCPWGHPHSTTEKAARCSAWLSSSSAPTLGLSSAPAGSSRTPAGSSRTPAGSSSSATLRASPADSTSASALPAGISTSGRIRGDPHTRTSTGVATAAPTETGHDWFGLRQRATLQAGAAPVPLAPPSAPVVPSYVAQIDPYNPSVDIWYIVTVGTRVGVFCDQFVATNATYRVSGQHYRHYTSYNEAVQVFRAAEAAGAVFQRNPKY